jgi:hypothetical protein
MPNRFRQFDLSDGVFVMKKLTKTEIAELGVDAAINLLSALKEDSDKLDPVSIMGEAALHYSWHRGLHEALAMSAMYLIDKQVKFENKLSRTVQDKINDASENAVSMLAMAFGLQGFAANFQILEIMNDAAQVAQREHKRNPATDIVAHLRSALIKIGSMQTVRNATEQTTERLQEKIFRSRQPKLLNMFFEGRLAHELSIFDRRVRHERRVLGAVSEIIHRATE